MVDPFQVLDNNVTSTSTDQQNPTVRRRRGSEILVLHLNMNENDDQKDTPNSSIKSSESTGESSECVVCVESNEVIDNVNDVSSIHPQQNELQSSTDCQSSTVPEVPSKSINISGIMMGSPSTDHSDTIILPTNSSSTIEKCTLVNANIADKTATVCSGDDIDNDIAANFSNISNAYHISSDNEQIVKFSDPNSDATKVPSPGKCTLNEVKSCVKESIVTSPIIDNEDQKTTATTSTITAETTTTTTTTTAATATTIESATVKTTKTENDIEDIVKSDVSSTSSSALGLSSNFNEKCFSPPPSPDPTISPTSSNNRQTDDRIIINQNSVIEQLGQVESLDDIMEGNRNISSNNSPTSTTHIGASSDANMTTTATTTTTTTAAAATTTTTTVPPLIDNRKVEPLKINLQRDPIILKIHKQVHENSFEPVVPKITIKQICKPPSEDDPSKMAIIVDSSTTMTSTTTNNISNLEPPQEPHIVPKLTIRNSTNASGSGSQSVIVPKLTIKMDNHVAIPSVAGYTNKEKSLMHDDDVHPKITVKPIAEPPIPKLTIKSNSDEHAEVVNRGERSMFHEDGVKLSIKPIAEPAIPKLTIKATSDEHAEVVNKDTATFKRLSVQEDGIKLSIKSINEPAIPKLTIKTNSEEHAEVVNKTDTVRLSIKTVSAHPSPPPPPPIPKLTIKTSSDDHAEVISIKEKPQTCVQAADQPPLIPKMTIKASSDEHAEVVNNTKYSINAGPSSPATRGLFKSNPKSSSDSIVPKLKIKQISNADESSEQALKFTIKRSDENSSESSLSSSPVSSLSSSHEGLNCIETTTTTTKTIPKLVVRVPKDVDGGNSNNIISSTSSSSSTEPSHSTITTTTSNKHSSDDDEPEISSAMIKKSTEPPSNVEAIPKLTIRQIKDPEQPPDEKIVIPKVTIKPIINPDNESEDTEALVTPKITLKPIPKPIDISQPLEIVTTTSCVPLKSKIESTDSQQSPRIILKINKNQTESITISTDTKSTDKDHSIGSSMINDNQNTVKVYQDEHISSSLSCPIDKPSLKRPNSSCSTSIIGTSGGSEVKRQKIDNLSHDTAFNSGGREDDNLNINSSLLLPCVITSLTNSKNCQKVENIVKEKSNLNEIERTKNADRSGGNGGAKVKETLPIAVADTSSMGRELKPDINISDTNNTKFKLNSTVLQLFRRETECQLSPSPSSSLLLDQNVHLSLIDPISTAVSGKTSSNDVQLNKIPNQKVLDDQRSSDVIEVSEGSSSDCIMMEETVSIRPLVTSFSADQLNKNGGNAFTKRIDHNIEFSVVDVPIIDDTVRKTPATKRGRGRPRKNTPKGNANATGSVDKKLKREPVMGHLANATESKKQRFNNEQNVSVDGLTNSNFLNVITDKITPEAKVTRSSTFKILNAKSQTINIEPTKVVVDKKNDDITHGRSNVRTKIDQIETPTEAIPKMLTIETVQKSLVDTITETIISKVKDNDKIECKSSKLEHNSSIIDVRAEDNRSHILHPLLLQNIQRAKLLESIMGPSKDMSSLTVSTITATSATPTQTVSNVNNISAPVIQGPIEMSEDSSSDCILIEDNGSRSFPQTFSEVDPLHLHKSNLEVTIDRDSGVEVSNSLKSLVEVIEVESPTVKRGRGRPKKSDIRGTPIDKKQIVVEDDFAKRKFAGVLLAEYAKNKDITTVPIASVDVKPEIKPEVKERKRRIRIDDDDESPTFNPLSRNVRRGRGRGGRGGRGRGKLKMQQRSGSINLLSTPDKSRDSAVFTTPEGKDKRKPFLKETTVLQVFEEDTRMSADSLTTPLRNSEFLHNEESQNSLLSTASVTMESSVTKIKRSKIEVADPEGKTEFTVDMIAEYDWPPPKGCCPARNRDTYMIQEQIAEYLGVKSFKRKYQDLPRRTVEMEERNYLLEKGMVSEKMCDLGLTAVLASDVLDIMHNDFYDKYEEYKKYLREKQIRDLAAKQKAMQMEAVEKNLSAREHAIRAASSWNVNFNKSRKEDRRNCLDLQNMIVHLPDTVRKKMCRPMPALSNYPIALVPGQFQEYYYRYNAAELLCYPINTALADPVELDKKLREYSRSQTINDSDSDSSSDSDDDDDDDDDEDDSDDSDDSSSDSSECSNDEIPAKNEKCRVCARTQHSNQDNKPEMFVKCSTCRRKAHPSCIEMPARMATRITEYPWQCSECKYCLKCRQSINEEKMLFCDQCDRGYHIYCLGIQVIPSGRWHCDLCSICTNCGSRQSEGQRKPNLTNHQYKRLLATSKWTHEYRINHISNLREHFATLCVPCAKARNNNDKT